jgi:hypothetical protein
MTNNKSVVLKDGTTFNVVDGKVTKIDGEPVADLSIDLILVKNDKGQEVMRLSNDGTILESVVPPFDGPDLCPGRDQHGNPLRFCPIGCGWIEPPETEQQFLGNDNLVKGSKLTGPGYEISAEGGNIAGQVIPTPTKPTLGRVVHYRLTENDARSINIRRADWHETNVHGPQNIGYQAHVGNFVKEGEIFAADIVRVFEDGHLNLQVKLDGNDTFWATSVTNGRDNGNWFWPPRA